MPLKNAFNSRSLLHGRLRVTVQGEVIEQNFGEDENCFHTLDLYTAATLEHSLKPPTEPTDDWRKIMLEMSDESCARYREVGALQVEIIQPTS